MEGGGSKVDTRHISTKTSNIMDKYTTKLSIIYRNRNISLFGACYHSTLTFHERNLKKPSFDTLTIHLVLLFVLLCITCTIIVLLYYFVLLLYYFVLLVLSGGFRNSVRWGPKGELRCKNGHEIKSAERRRRVASYD